MKNKLTKILSLLLVAIQLGACSGNNNTSSISSSFDNSQSSYVDSNLEEKKTYSISLKKTNGDAIEGAKVSLYKNDAEISFSTSNSDGIALVKAVPDIYDIVVTDLPDGYHLDKETKTTADNFKIELTCIVKPYSTEVPADKIYQEGEIMYDFNFTSISGDKLNLTEMLGDYDMVVLNFWYVNCSYCVLEMPYLEETYEKYSDRVKLLAINSVDSINVIKNYVSSNKFTFDFISDSTDYYEHFSVEAWPTSVVIGKNGVIRKIHAGALTSADNAEEFFLAFLGKDVEAGEVTPDDNTPILPNVDPATSDELLAAVKGENFNTTFRGAGPTEEEYNWPWIVSEDKKSIHPSNYKIHNSYSILQMTISLQKDQLFSFDYLSSCEKYDKLYVYVNEAPEATICGVEKNWKTNYTYVALESGLYDFFICYIKDSTNSEGDDTVYLSNFSIRDKSVIKTPTYIFHYAGNDYNSVDQAYDNYITPVFNEEDNYYHVNSKNGPLLLADLMNATRHDSASIYDKVLNGDFAIRGVDYTQKMTNYALIGYNNKTGFTTVRQELRDILSIYYNSYRASKKLGKNENAYLDICCFYSAYGTGGKELSDPNIGLSTYSAYEAKLGDNNSVVVDWPVLPRYIYARFVPEQTGVYKIKTQGDAETVLYMLNEYGYAFHEYDQDSRALISATTEDPNAEMYVELEAGKTYFVGVNYYDFYGVGTIKYSISYLGVSYDLFYACAPGYFTTSDVDADNNPTGEIIALGIDIKMGDDGYYHALNKDGTLGSIIYADFSSMTSIFSYSLIQMINMGAFDFTVDEDGNKVADGVDETNNIKKYLSKVIRNQGDTNGCVPVDAELARLLQKFMDKYTFKDVKDSWLKLCYYYRHFGE